MKQLLQLLAGSIVLFALSALDVAPAIGPSGVDGVGGLERSGPEDKPVDGKPPKPEKITLERLFPEKGFFGPGATSPAFSFDGRYGAFLWKPHLERRHGSDLYIHDFQTGETSRITKVSVMSRYADDARKVRDDRVKKAKERAKKRKESQPAGADKADAAKVQGATVDGSKSDASKGDAAAKLAPPPDLLSGSWDGTLSASDGTTPPEGVAFTLVLQRAEGGGISGMFKSSLVAAALAEARFDEEATTLSFRLRRDEGGDPASFEAKLAEGTLQGSLTLGDGRKLAVRATRIAAAEVATGVGSGAAAGTLSWADEVDDKDADDEKAPRYAGVQSFTWSPTAHELIFGASGDAYRLAVDGGAITRLTRSREDESDVKWLPDGKGFTYMSGGGGGGRDLFRVRFGEDVIEQINPPMTGGERMNGYEISPDGKRLVFTASKGDTPRGREVNIVNYRDRFAEVSKVPRHMPDDPVGEVEEMVYLYDLDGLFEERAQLKKVFTRKRTGPRDTLRVPEWAPDSSRVAFAVFEQASGKVEIREAEFAPKDAKGAKDKKDSPDLRAASASSRAGADGTSIDTGTDGTGTGADAKTTGDAKTDSNKPERDPAEPAPDPEPAFEIRDARVVYRFLHNGGPTTPGLIEPTYLPDSRRMAFITELSGFRQLHVLDPMYEELQQLTRGRFELYPLKVSKDHTRMFALTTRDDPTQQQVEQVDLETGAITRLSRREGFHDGAAVSDDGRHALANHADFGSLKELQAIRAVREGVEGESRPITDSHPAEARKLTTAHPEYFVYRNRNGQEIHGHMFKPPDWTAQDKRPLLIYVYGGPLGQNKMAVRGSFAAPSYFFAWYMSQVHGYVTCTIDPRGASGYGGLFEKSNYEQVGKPQVEDLVDGAKWFIANHGVDPKRVGIHGWSFGGFQTQMCMYTEPETFAVGIAGAGPTEWENYNSWYSTGTIGASRAGQTDLSKFSLLPLAKNLKGRLLLVHGMEDSNVLYQDTVRVYRELLKAGKEALVDLFVDPTGSHGLGGDVKTLNRYRKYEDFLLTHLGKGKPGAVAATPPEVPSTPEATGAPPAAAK